MTDGLQQMRRAIGWLGGGVVASALLQYLLFFAAARYLGVVEYGVFSLALTVALLAAPFCDFGTTERQLAVNWDNYRVSPGLGLRLNIPALGPAPLALDFAIPIAHAPTDRIQNFSFFMGFGR